MGGECTLHFHVALTDDSNLIKLTNNPDFASNKDKFAYVVIQFRASETNAGVQRLAFYSEEQNESDPDMIKDYGFFAADGTIVEVKGAGAEHFAAVLADGLGADNLISVMCYE